MFHQVPSKKRPLQSRGYLERCNKALVQKAGKFDCRPLFALPA
jgi:hypothetical protein